MRELLITSGAVLSMLGCAVEVDDVPTRGEPLDQVCAGDVSVTAGADHVEGCRPGALDTAFGGAGTGIARLSIKPDDAGGFTALDLDLSGAGILAAGWGLGGLGGSTFKLARLRHDGTADASFGGGQIVETQWGASTANYATARAVGHLSSGKIVAIGGFDNVRSRDIALAGYHEDGTLDARGFAGGGQPLIDLGGDEVVLAGLVAPDGRLFAAGARDGRLFVARFTSGGELDAAFAGGKGYFTAPGWESSEALSLALDAQGRLVVAGSKTDGEDRDLVLVRLTAEGQLDLSFGAGGVVVSGEPDLDERAVAVAVAEGGEIVAAGDTGGEPARFLLARFRPDGAPDPCFGSGGVAVQSITGGDDRAESMALIPGGGILVAGNARGEGPVVARFTARGALDPTFGAGGSELVNLGEYGVLHTVAADGGGGVLLGGGDEGATPGPGTYAVVARMCL